MLVIVKYVETLKTELFIKVLNLRWRFIQMKHQKMSDYVSRKSVEKLLKYFSSSMTYFSNCGHFQIVYFIKNLNYVILLYVNTFSIFIYLKK